MGPTFRTAMSGLVVGLRTLAFLRLITSPACYRTRPAKAVPHASNKRRVVGAGLVASMHTNLRFVPIMSDGLKYPSGGHEPDEASGVGTVNCVFQLRERYIPMHV